MEINIQKNHEENPLVSNVVNGKIIKGHEASDQKFHQQYNNEEQTDTDDDYSEVHQGLSLLVDALIPGRKLLSELKGIAEMDAMGLQLFLAMQRQFFKIRMSHIHAHVRLNEASMNENAKK